MNWKDINTAPNRKLLVVRDDKAIYEAMNDQINGRDCWATAAGALDGRVFPMQWLCEITPLSEGVEQDHCEKHNETQLNCPECIATLLTPEFLAAADIEANTPITVSPDPSAALAEALEKIERWFGEFPETGRFWDEPENKQPMSYAACYGSNGERDYMREVARAALAIHRKA